MMLPRWLQGLFAAPPEIPAELWRQAVSLPCMRHLDREALQRLEQLASRFLDKPGLRGVAGLEVTDQMAVSIAAQACLPILNLGLELYRDISAVLVYPAAFLVAREEMDEAGVVHAWREPLSGEALDAGGAIALSWEDIEDEAAPDAAGNVVIHEFVHKLDMLNGEANGCPPFVPRWHAAIEPARWQAVFQAAYADFQDRVVAEEAPGGMKEEGGAETLFHTLDTAALPLDAYAATHPAEFFAVASEAFFMTGAGLHAAYPDVYALLSAYYRQDTRERAGD